MLVITTTNSPDLTLFAIVDKVTSEGLFEGVRWNRHGEEFETSVGESNVDADYLIPLIEIINGYYSAEVELIDEDQILRVIILTDDEQAIGISYFNFPIEVAPEVQVSFEVEEDRNT